MYNSYGSRPWVGGIFSLSATPAYTNLLRTVNDPLWKTPAILAGAKPFFAIQFPQRASMPRAATA